MPSTSGHGFSILGPHRLHQSRHSQSHHLSRLSKSILGPHTPRTSSQPVHGWSSHRPTPLLSLHLQSRHLWHHSQPQRVDAISTGTERHHSPHKTHHTSHTGQGQLRSQLPGGPWPLLYRPTGHCKQQHRAALIGGYGEQLRQELHEHGHVRRGPWSPHKDQRWRQRRSTGSPQSWQRWSSGRQCWQQKGLHPRLPHSAIRHPHQTGQRTSNWVVSITSTQAHLSHINSHQVIRSAVPQILRPHRAQ